MRLNVVLAVILAIVSLDIDYVESSGQYKRLNDYLAAHVGNYDLAPNMEAAKNWLKELENTKQSMFSNKPVDDLKKFISLQQVINDDKCDQKVYEIKRINEAAVDLHKKHYDNNVSRQIDRVMLNIFQNHAMKCSEIYPVVHQKRKSKLDEHVYIQVERISKLIIDAHRKTLKDPNSPFLFEPDFYFETYILNQPEIGHFSRKVTILREALELNVRGDSDSKFLHEVKDNHHAGKSALHKDKIRELVKKHLIGPCQQYETAMGRGLFIPARFDVQTYFHVDDTKGDFYLDWAYFRICQALTSNEKVVFEKVIKLVSDSAH